MDKILFAIKKKKKQPFLTANKGKQAKVILVALAGPDFAKNGGLCA